MEERCAAQSCMLRADAAGNSTCLGLQGCTLPGCLIQRGMFTSSAQRLAYHNGSSTALISTHLDALCCKQRMRTRALSNSSRPNWAVAGARRWRHDARQGEAGYSAALPFRRCTGAGANQSPSMPRCAGMRQPDLVTCEACHTPNGQPCCRASLQCACWWVDGPQQCMAAC